MAAKKLPGIALATNVLSASLSLGQTTIAPTMSCAPVRLAHLFGHSLPSPPPWMGILPSVFTAVPVLSEEYGDWAAPNPPLLGSLTSGLLHPI